MAGESVLVFEDDVIWKPDAWEQLKRFMEIVPSDWDQLMLGGQHLEAAEPVSSGVVRCRNTQRTHAYAIRGEAMKSLLGLWFTCSVHIDWAMGPWQKNWKVYAPDPFLFGQSGGKSDISGNHNERKFWTAPDKAPVVVLDCPRSVADQLRGYGLHTGFNRDSDGYDKGLVEVVKAENRDSAMRNWLSTLMWEAASMEDSYVTVWHPKIWYEHVVHIHQGQTIRCRGNTLEECLEQLKDLKLKQNVSASHCLVLRAPRAVAENLPGFHLGNWRDKISGLDNGIREAEYLQGHAQIDRLKKWFVDVGPEAERMGAVPMVWSDRITLESVQQATSRTVREIKADTVEEVLREWKSSQS